ncbi:DNA repair and recombination protein mus-11 [Erysiphe neolycopersici]|uniref:RAD52 homolog n=1 Tax=Erysiphe neolycopersici TaxID=212602 RepID=A0A420I4C6_9PEZI|nr:DNA repair and recombination protein mus-11 [Erysiphe neolycopersici]
MNRVSHQHLRPRGRTGRCEESVHQVSTYTAQEIATLQSRLEKQLGPEYLSSRCGPGGQKIHYIAAEKCIQLANAVFGFNGWSSQIIDFQVDFIDENPQTLKVSLGLSVVVRVTLKDGTFHEDIGYGHVENFKAKAAAFEKAKKEGTTDALKRALRNFGNVLGNCIYDKEYLRQVSKVKPFSPKWSEDNLFRHSSFFASSGMKNKSAVGNETVNPIVDKAKQSESSGTVLAREVDASEEFFEEDFGDFDEADFGVTDPESHPDEVVLSESAPLPATSSTDSIKLSPNPGDESRNKNTGTVLGGNTIQTSSVGNRQSVQKQNILPCVQSPKSSHLKTPSLDSTLGRDSVVQNKVNKQSSGNITSANRILNQPNRTNNNNQTSSLNSPELKNNNLPNIPKDHITPNTPILKCDFYSARAANIFSPILKNENMSTVEPPDMIPDNFPTFNPHAESPSIRKTPGVDHRSSKPLTKDLKHIPSSSQASAASVILGSNSSGVFSSRSNILNPSLDNVRRIGAPGSPSPSGMSHSKGTGFKIPMKRTTECGAVRTLNGVNRVPLETLSANTNTNGSMIDIIDPKRQKLHS